MCKFCKDGFKLETNIFDNELVIYLEEDNKQILNLRFPSKGGGGITKPIMIYYCPFCGFDLRKPI